MNLQRREEISALLAEPVTGEAGQALEYRDALMECRTHIDTLEQTAAERVIRDGSGRLGDGMVAVDRAKLARLIAEVDDALDRYESGSPIQASELMTALLALRANQGGAAT